LSCSAVDDHDFILTVNIRLSYASLIGLKGLARLVLVTAMLNFNNSRSHDWGKMFFDHVRQKLYIDT